MIKYAVGCHCKGQTYCLTALGHFSVRHEPLWFPSREAAQSLIDEMNICGLYVIERETNDFIIRCGSV